MARRRSRVVRAFAGFLSIAFSRLTALLPLSLARALGRVIGAALFALAPQVRRRALDNIRAAYGDTLTDQEQYAIARGAAMNVGIVAAEFAHIPRLTPSELGRWVDCEGLEYFDRERPGFCLGAHIGNWEWMAAVMAGVGFKVAEVVRPLDSPALNRYVDHIRTFHGVRTIDKTGGGQELIRLLKDGWLVGVLADQAPRESAVPVTFFGRECWATVAPAMVALRARVPIHVVTMTRNADGRYTLRVSPQVELPRSGDFRQDILLITQRCQDLLEAEIRRHPDQWLWLHRRWKDRPRLADEWARKQTAPTE